MDKFTTIAAIMPHVKNMDEHIFVIFELWAHLSC